MATKRGMMNIIIASLLLQATGAQQIITPEIFYSMFSNFAAQQRSINSDTKHYNYNYNYNFANVYPLSYEDIATSVDQQLKYQTALLQALQTDFYGNGFNGFVFVPSKASQLDPSLAFFLAFCNLNPIQIPINCDTSQQPNEPTGGVTPTKTEVPSTSKRCTTSVTPVTGQTSPPLSVPPTSSSPVQTPSASTALSGTPTRAPSTNAPTTRSKTTQPPPKRQPATTQRPSSAAKPTTEDPTTIAIRLGDLDEELGSSSATAATTEEEYLPLDFEPVTPDYASNVTLPPLLHTPGKK